MILNKDVSLPILGQRMVDDYLVRQRDLTAVERFSHLHEDGELPHQSKYYRDLIPMTKPRPGEQYAFEVDLDACTGCKACVAACHTLNGLDENETWRDVGLLIGGPIESPMVQHVTTACHHCLEPACMEGCPVDAYEKDPVTGIVRHLDDQCIGCQYCTLKCPYDVPKYNKKKGIVRKCDMCSDRLAEGEAPACVQACPSQAIKITLVNKRHVAADSEANVFLPGAPSPDYTHPTTNYKTRRPLPRNLLPADYYHVQPQHAHWPLVVMLALTQLSVGGFLIGRVVEGIGGGVFEIVRPVHALVSLMLGLLALGASTMHLGRPLYAFRAVIGLRRSWLSREIVAFGLFAKLAAVYAGISWFLPHLGGGAALKGIGTAVVLTGLLGVFCSAMIYHDTRRAFWKIGRTITKFALTTLGLGLSVTLLAGMIAAGFSSQLSVHEFANDGGRSLSGSLAAVMGFKLLFEAWTLRHLSDKHHTLLKRTAILMVGELRGATAVRFAAGLLGGVLLPLLMAGGQFQGSAAAMICTTIAAVFVLTLIGELLERYLFFTSVVAPKMPGSIH